MIVCFEGGDGCGKDTVAEALATMMDAKLFRFPDDDAVTGPMIRDYLAKRWWVAEPLMCAGQRVKSESTHAEKASAMAFQALMVANRMERMAELQQREREGKVSVLVRYWQSGWVYGGLDGLDDDFLIQLHTGMAKPMLNILLDVDAETSLRRVVGRGEDLERYEGKLDFTRKVIARYRKLWDEEALRKPFNSNGIACYGWYKVDATQELPRVIAEVGKLVLPRWARAL